MDDNSMSPVAVIGLGAMGSRLAARLLENDYEVIVWNRTPAHAYALVERGARLAQSPADATRQAMVLITSVADPDALRAVVAGAHGIAAGAHDGLVLIEMSTVGPDCVAEMESMLPLKAALIDAPVLGSVDKAATGALTIFVGGADEDIERCNPLLRLLGTVIRVGPTGAGAAAKLVANEALFGVLCLLGESLALARYLGLTDENAFKVLAATPLADQARRRRRIIEAADYAPRFTLRLARKDSQLVADAAAARGAMLPLAEAVRAWLVDAVESGSGGRDYTAVLDHVLRATGGSRK